MGKSTAPPAEPDRSARGRGYWHRLAGLLGALFVAPALLAAVLLFALSSEQGAGGLWRIATWASQGNWSGTYAGGTLLHGLHLRNVAYRDQDTQVDIDDIDGRWNLSGMPLHLTVETLRVGTVNIRLPPASVAPPMLPRHLGVPIEVTIDSLVVHKLTFHQGASTVEFGAASLHGEFGGTEHTLALDRLDTPFGDAAATLRLSAAAPFSLAGRVELTGAYQQQHYRIAMGLSGTLATLDCVVDASGDKLNGHAHIKATPFAATPFERLELTANHVNPKIFNAAAPQADLALHAALVPVPADAADPTSAAISAAPRSAFAVGGPVTLVNALPGGLDIDRLPLVSAAAEVRLAAETQQLTQLKIELTGKGRLDGHGALRKMGSGGTGGEFQFAAVALDLHALYGKLKPTRMHGAVTVTLQPGWQQVRLRLDDRQLSVELAALIDRTRVNLQTARLSAGAASLDLSGTLARTTQAEYVLQGNLRGFNPAQWLDPTATGKPGASALQAHVNMDFEASGSVAPVLKLKLKFAVHDSDYANLPMTGNGVLDLAGKRLLPTDVQLSVAGNTLLMKGSFGAVGDRIDVDLNAPQLDRLGLGLAGSLKLQGQLSGTLARPNVHASFRAERLAFGAHRLAQLSGHADLQGDLAATGELRANAGLAAKIEAQGYVGPDGALSRLTAALAGTYGNHTLTASADGTLRGKSLGLDMAAQGKLAPDDGDTRWDGVIGKLELRRALGFSLGAPVALSLSAGRVALGASNFMLADGLVDLKNFSYDHGVIRSEGNASALKLGHLLAMLHQWSGIEAPLKTDLVLDGRWNFSLADKAGGFAEITRRSGDFTLPTGSGENALGLTDLRLRAELQSKHLQFDARAAAPRIGTLSAEAQAVLTLERGAPVLSSEAPLSGHASLTMLQLKMLGALLGPQIALDGSIGAELSASGTLGRPKWSGQISGDNLALTFYDQGIQLKNGIARVTLNENVIELHQLQFSGGDGILIASGKLQLGQANPDLSAIVVANHLQLFASPDRQLSVSGQATVASSARGLQVGGKFKVDRALFDLPKSSVPQLGEDVVILRRNGKNAATAGSAQDRTGQASRYSPSMDLQIDLGDDFRFHGSGADLQLRGSMEVRSEPLSPMRASGTVRVASGNYEAFGRKLAIERGSINFQGRIDNPNVDILAMRRNQAVEAGVEVSGFARQPRIKLVSEPNVADEEKLSWLMFGHGSESSGPGQQRAANAALGLLGNVGGKRLTEGSGLDTFSIGSSESGLNNQQVVNVGKAISEAFTIGYEQSLTSAASIAKLTWQISRRWSMIARVGSINGIDLLFNQRYD